jgi:protein-tyrosine phosphatase
MIDLHCHILPGADDGAKTLEHALAMGRFARDDGITKIVATPHLFREDLGQAGYASIRRKREDLRIAFAANDIPIKLFSGAEVHIPHNLIHEIKSNRNDLVINDGSYMFVEFPQDHVFSGAKDLFFELMSEGIKPIIAHPERNTVFMQNPTRLYELIQMGVLVQSNSGSFCGRYGREVEESAFRFLKYRFIHFIASDGHGVRSIPPQLSEAVRIIASVIGENDARALVQENCQAVLDNETIPNLPDPVNPRGKRKSFFVKIPKL